MAQIKEKVTTPKREKMLRVIARAAQAQSLIGQHFFTDDISSTIPNEYYTDTDGVEQYGHNPSLLPEGGCKSAGRCAMAELFFAAGYSNNKLAQMGGTDEEWEQKDFRVLWDQYRIDAKDASRIIGANDDIAGCSLEAFEKRQNKVSKVIEGLKDRVRVNPYRYNLSNGQKNGLIPTKKETEVLKRLGMLEQYKEAVSNGDFAY